MIYVNAPASEVIEILSATDEPVYNGMRPDGTPKPLTQTYQQFLLARTADEAFSEGKDAGGKKEGIDLFELTHLARAQIRATRGKPGPHVFDTEVAKRLQAAILHPKTGRLSQPEFEHNWFDWVLLWKSIKEDPAVVAQSEATNG